MFSGADDKYKYSIKKPKTVCVFYSRNKILTFLNYRLYLLTVVFRIFAM